MNDPQAAPQKARLRDHQHDQHGQHEEQTRQVQASAAVPTTGLIQFGSDDGVACEGDTCWTSLPKD